MIPVGSVTSGKRDPLLPTPRWWQELALAKLEGHGGRARLAREIGVSAPTITKALRSGNQYSYAVLPISRALGIEAPSVPLTEARSLELYELAQRLARGLGDEQYEALVAWLRTYPVPVEDEDDGEGDLSDDGEGFGVGDDSDEDPERH